MSKNYEMTLADSVLFDIASEIAEAVGRETRKMALFSCSAYNDFLKPRQYATGLISSPAGLINAQKLTSSAIKQPALKAKPSDIEIAQFIELKAQQLGYQSQGIKLLPEKTGEIIEFTFEKPREKEKVLRGGES